MKHHSPGAQNAANVHQRQTYISINTDLLQPEEILLAVAAIVAACTKWFREKPDRFVVEQRTAAQSALARELSDGQHRSDLSVNPKVIDRSTQKQLIIF